MARNSTLTRAVKIALITSAAVGTAAIAQEGEIEQIVVTGSRIAIPNLEAISPVASITAADIKATGATRVEDVLNDLPQVFAAQGSTVSNGSNGTATVDLRGLGSNRTLVLVNGRRLSPGQPTGGSAADINQIPGAMIERIEVLTGGASSVYGADAVAGVVNFIMQKDFEGLRLDINGSTNWHNNHDETAQKIVKLRGFPAAPGEITTGDAIDIMAVLGGNFADDRGNATAYLGYRSVDPVLQSEYDYSACTFSSKNKNSSGVYTGNGERFNCGGSGTSYPGYFELVGDPNAYTIGEGNVLRPFTSNDVYNFGPLNYYQRPDERYTAGVFAHYEFSEAADVYSEFMYMKDRTLAQIAPSGIFFDPTMNIRCDNPMLSPSMVSTWCTANGLAGEDEFQLYIGRRNVEGGGRVNDLTHYSYRAVLGVRGDIGKAWQYDTYAMQGETELSNVYLNDFFKDRVQQALDVVLDGDGNLVCRDASGGCQPWNIFSLGGVTPGALSFLQVPAVAVGTATTRVISANFTGDLGEYGITFPTAKDGIAVNVGAEWRDERTNFQPDYIFQTGGLTGQGGTTDPVKGGYSVKELFIESRIPFIQDHFLASSLSADLGYRFSDYSLGFDTDSWKIGLEWAPIEDVRLRGGFNRSVRAPNVGELFSPQSVSLDGSTDPCAGANPAAVNPNATEANCARTGVLPGQYGFIAANNASQYNGLQGGNPDLNAETADTATFGVVLQPRFLDGLYIAIDYFDIKIKDVISGVGADLAINTCLNTGDPFFCSLIHRNAQGSLWRSSDGYIIDTLQNLGELRTSGVDVDARYSLQTDSLGTFTTTLMGTYLDKLETQPLPNDPSSYDCAGLYGTVCGTPNPEWRHTLKETWTTPWEGISLSIAWTYFDKVALDATVDNPNFNPSAYRDSDKELGARNYLDIGAGWTFAEKYSLRFGINNVLDKDPPLTGSTNCPSGICNGNTYAQVYDTLGRYVFLGLTADF